MSKIHIDVRITIERDDIARALGLTDSEGRQALFEYIEYMLPKDWAYGNPAHDIDVVRINHDEVDNRST